MSSKYLAARLLSRRNRLTRVEKDAILTRVLAEVVPRRAPRWPAMLLALAGVAALLVLVPRALRDRGDGAGDDGFAARGAGSGFGLLCAGQPSRTCRLGQKLMFDVQGSSYRYFAAFARRDDGTVIWYFPDSTASRSVDLREQRPEGVLARGILLDATHGAGRYRVYGIHSAAPLSRDDIKARFEPGAADLGPETSVSTRELVVP